MFIAKTYLRFLSFIYLITIWQVFIILFFVLISYDVSLWQAAIVAAPLILSTGRGVLDSYDLKKSSASLVLMVITLTTVEFFIFLQLLPLHYIILASMLMLWFFFLVEMVLTGQELSSRKRVFKVYGAALIAAFILILITARWG